MNTGNDKRFDASPFLTVCGPTLGCGGHFEMIPDGKGAYRNPDKCPHCGTPTVQTYYRKKNGDYVSIIKDGASNTFTIEP